MSSLFCGGEEQIASFNHTLAALAISHPFHCGQDFGASGW